MEKMSSSYRVRFRTSCCITHTDVQIVDMMEKEKETRKRRDRAERTLCKEEGAEKGEGGENIVQREREREGRRRRDGGEGGESLSD